MTAHVATALPSTPASEVTAQMKRLDIRHILICDQNGQLLGVVSDRDLHDVAGKTAGKIMTHKPITVAPEMLVKTAITMMLEHHVSSLPVAEKGKLLGILTTTDMVMTLQCTMQLVEQMVKEMYVTTSPHAGVGMCDTPEDQEPALSNDQLCASPQV